MEGVPKVTKETPKTSVKEQYSSFFCEWLKFENSETILVCRGREVRLSFDNGENWQTVLEIGEDIEHVFPDEFHKGDRAFVEDVVGHLYIIGNQGRWMEIQKPVEVEKAYPSTIKTHPLEKDYILLECDIEGGEFERVWISGTKSETMVYVSKDCGRSFKRVLAPVEDYDVTPDVTSHGTECWFAASSCNSTLSRELIYGLHSLTAINEQGTITVDKCTLFYSPDLGQTTELVGELRGFSVSRLQIFSSGILVTTSENRQSPIEKLWVSTGGPFKEAHLPEELKYTSFGEGLEDDLGRVHLPIYTTESDHQRKYARLLIWDFLTFKLSQFDPVPLNPKGRSYVKKFGHFRGTLWGQLFGVIPEDEQTQNYVSLPVSDNNPSLKRVFDKYMSVISINNGKSWSKLRFTDPSNKYRDLFKCDVEDLENSSLHIFYYTNSQEQKSMEEVIMAKGVVLHSNPRFSGSRCMTFMSRDAGANWELAFEFPVYSVFANTGNIIVAVPQLEEEFRSFCITKIFYSLNRGKTWGEYALEEPVSAKEIELDTSNLSVTVKLVKRTGRLANKIDTDKSLLYTLDFSQLSEIQ